MGVLLEDQPALEGPLGELVRAVADEPLGLEIFAAHHALAGVFFEAEVALGGRGVQGHKRRKGDELVEIGGGLAELDHERAVVRGGDADRFGEALFGGLPELLGVEVRVGEAVELLLPPGVEVLGALDAEVQAGVVGGHLWQ